MSKTREALIEEINALTLQVEALDTAPQGYAVIRSRDSGCWLGQVTYRHGDEVELADARRLYYWDGAATLSQLALEGVSKPGNCKFPPAVPRVRVLGVCEIIQVSAAALLSVRGVKEWRA